MNVPQELDPRVKGVEKKVKLVGMIAVAVVASGVVLVAGVSVIVAGVVALAALGVVNFVVPVGARYIALRKQEALTALDEKFSESTIRMDEQEEGDRVKILEDQYKVSRSELEGAQEELRDQMQGATEDEQKMLQAQVDTLQGVIDDAEATLLQRKQDFEELKRVNKLYIAFHRSAAAMQRAQGAERDPAELQRLETARSAIKTRMRAAMAGKTIEAMNSRVQQKVGMAKVAQIGHSRPVEVPVQMKGVQHVSTNR